MRFLSKLFDTETEAVIPSICRELLISLVVMACVGVFYIKTAFTRQVALGAPLKAI